MRHILKIFNQPEMNMILQNYGVIHYHQIQRDMTGQEKLQKVDTPLTQNNVCYRLLTAMKIHSQLRRS